MGGSVSAKVILRHMISDTVTSTWSGRVRTITYMLSSVELPRPAQGAETFRLICPTCNGDLLIELRDKRRTDRGRVVRYLVATVCLLVLVASAGYALQVGGRTLPEGTSGPALFPISVVAAFVTFVATPTLFIAGWCHRGVKLIAGPKPRRGHRVGATDLPRSRPEDGRTAAGA